MQDLTTVRRRFSVLLRVAAPSTTAAALWRASIALASLHHLVRWNLSGFFRLSLNVYRSRSSIFSAGSCVTNVIKLHFWGYNALVRIGEKVYLQLIAVVRSVFATSRACFDSVVATADALVAGRYDSTHSFYLWRYVCAYVFLCISVLFFWFVGVAFDFIARCAAVFATRRLRNSLVVARRSMPSEIVTLKTMYCMYA